MLYLLHASTPLRRSNGTGALHYLGWTEDGDLLRRLRLHRSGRARVALTTEFHRRGIKLLLTAIWPGGTRTMERRLKDNGHLAQWCPLCRNGLKHRDNQYDAERINVTLYSPRVHVAPSPKLPKVSGGEPSPGSQTASVGWFQAPLLLDGSTTSNASRVRPTGRGGPS